MDGGALKTWLVQRLTSDEAKTEWAALATGDHAIIGWRISDSPAVAYEVCVLPDS